MRTVIACARLLVRSHDPAIRAFAALLALALLGVILLGAAPQSLPADPLPRGDALMLRGRYADALAAYDAALESDPRDRSARYARGTALLALGDPEAAESDFRALLAAGPPPTLGDLGLAQVEMAAGRFGTAGKYLAEALAFDPGSAEAHFQHGMLLWHLGEAGDAVNEFEAALQIDPGKAYANFYAGLCYRRLRRVGEAAAKFDQFLALAPDAPEAPQARTLVASLKRC